jgi:hypothetical protein
LREPAVRRTVRIVLGRPRVVRDLLDLLFQRHLQDQQIGALLGCEGRVHPWEIGMQIRAGN